jgi:hypothetical protein
MKEDAYEQLINIALETKDFKWVKELQKQKAQEIIDYKANTENNEYIISGTAFEDLTSQYVVIEEHGVRNIRFESEYDICYGKVGLTDGKLVYKGQNVKYRDINDGERYYLFGWFRGYIEGSSRFSTFSPSIEKTPMDKTTKTNHWWKLWNKTRQ